MSAAGACAWRRTAQTYIILCYNSIYYYSIVYHIIVYHIISHAKFAVHRDVSSVFSVSGRGEMDLCDIPRHDAFECPRLHTSNSLLPLMPKATFTNLYPFQSFFEITSILSEKPTLTTDSQSKSREIWAFDPSTVSISRGQIPQTGLSHRTYY